MGREGREDQRVGESDGIVGFDYGDAEESGLGGEGDGGAVAGAVVAFALNVDIFLRAVFEP